MRVLIEIPDNWREQKSKMKVLVDAVRNGTPLPKGHGRLIDADAVFKECFPKADINEDALYNMTQYPYWGTNITGIISMLNNAPTIIEADKESTDETTD